MSKFKNNAHVLLEREDEDLPYKPGRKSKLTKAERHDRWRAGHDTWHKTDGVSPWKRAERLLRDGVGKRFDAVFAAYCKAVPKYQQHIFLQNVDPAKELRNPIWRWNEFYVDANGLIAKRKGRKPWQKPKQVTFRSFDYETEKRHKTNGYKQNRSYWDKIDMRALNEFYGKDAVRGKQHHELSKMYDEMFEDVVISGWSKTFESSKDPEYQRLMAERKKAIRKSRRLADRLADEKVYRFTHETEQQRAERLTANWFKILKHGFDPETSFRKDPEE